MLASLLYFCLGAFFWTFLEYALHRSLGHHPKLKNPFTVEHLRHHKEVNYFAPAAKKALGAVVVIAGIAAGLALILPLTSALAFATGLLLCYLVYEWAHSYLHTHAPLNRYGMLLRQHHFYHHFHNPDCNHGVTTPFWDLVFGTYVKIEAPVEIPRRASLPWLMTEEEELDPSFEGLFVLIK